MADTAPVVHIGENSPEEVAYKLYRIVGDFEGKTTSFGQSKSGGGADRKYVLDLYAECLKAVRGHR